ncbi:TPA: hypothetical protein HA249_03890 [Candidatus Woesearchaeota archaeon]|nr:hypothetical protein [Candidatus Woesearchaeota archaeon]HII88360.1 hypothetical protein [Candidatus Woesearchaeota archaeon]
MAVTMEQFEEILMALTELQEDNTIPKNVKTRLTEVTTILSSKSDGASIKINKALDHLGEISDDVNLQAYTRTQIWNIVSMLETI